MSQYLSLTVSCFTLRGQGGRKAVTQLPGLCSFGGTQGLSWTDQSVIGLTRVWGAPHQLLQGHPCCGDNATHFWLVIMKLLFWVSLQHRRLYRVSHRASHAKFWWVQGYSCTTPKWHHPVNWVTAFPLPCSRSLSPPRIDPSLHTPFCPILPLACRDLPLRQAQNFPPVS